MNYFILKGFSIIISLLCFTPLQAQKPQKGKASYYSKKATGALTSSGIKLHHDSLTCAHRTYPFGTILKVTNPRNSKSVLVKVTDRGPFGRGRIIDLSWAAAKAIDMLSAGVAMVIVERHYNTIVPFKAVDKISIPELDFETTEDEDGLHPAWKDMKSKKTNDSHHKSANVRDEVKGNNHKDNKGVNHNDGKVALHNESKSASHNDNKGGNRSDSKGASHENNGLGQKDNKINTHSDSKAALHDKKTTTKDNNKPSDKNTKSKLVSHK